MLGGCGAASKVNTGTTAIPIYNDATHKEAASFPAALGLMEPSVADYRCSGDYAPAMRKAPSSLQQEPYVGLPLWQLTLRCVNPKLKFNLPKGFIRPGMVWVSEQPTSKTALLEAMQFLHPVSHRQISSIGNLPIGEGRLTNENLVWLLGDKTTFIGFHNKTETGTVLVYLTGRAVSMKVLKEFAKSMHPLPSGP